MNMDKPFELQVSGFLEISEHHRLLISTIKGSEQVGIIKNLDGWPGMCFPKVGDVFFANSLQKYEDKQMGSKFISGNFVSPKGTSFSATQKNVKEEYAFIVPEDFIFTSYTTEYMQGSKTIKYSKEGKILNPKQLKYEDTTLVYHEGYTKNLNWGLCGLETLLSNIGVENLKSTCNYYLYICNCDCKEKQTFLGKNGYKNIVMGDDDVDSANSVSWLFYTVTKHILQKQPL